MKNNPLLLTLLTSLLFISLIQAGEEPLTKKIEITNESYGKIYPAVWFNPNDGSIHKLTEKSDKPPVEGATIWIEPGDPEFRVGPKIKGITLYYVGEGEETFNGKIETKDLEELQKIKRSLLSENKKHVIYVSTPESDSVVIIDDNSEENFKFRWKKISSH